MVINHNLSAIFANRQLKFTGWDVNKDIEKLSSGMRINRAGDDASGLAVSEKMRSQIRGLRRAEKNVEDGISFIQTAEGYLEETQSILQRFPGGEGHHEEQEPIDLSGVVEREDMRVIQPGDRLDLPEKPVHPHGLGQLRIQDFYSDLPTVFEILGQVDRGHPARSDLSFDRVSGGECLLDLRKAHCHVAPSG